jgi:phosphoglycolate phosphatase-like HAD superfamily hydrolase
MDRVAMMETAGTEGMETWLRVLDPGVLARLGRVRHALFDFDGTLSVLRQGWEDVMVPLMVEAICGPRPAGPAIEQEVSDYVDRSTGILTIRQMQWLAEAVGRHGLAGPALTAREYKARYLERLMIHVRRRIDSLVTGQAAPAGQMIAGSVDFLAGLARRGARLYLASGTDHADVVREARALGLLEYFDGGVYGALDDNEDHAKERVIQRILDEHRLAGEALLVAGDGPVEIREGALRRALTLGVASDEVARAGWNSRKAARLAAAGAALLVPDFTHSAGLLALLFEPQAARP